MAEVQTLLVCGRKREALHCAQEGHLWGPALVLAAQLGDQVGAIIFHTLCCCNLLWLLQWILFTGLTDQLLAYLSFFLLFVFLFCGVGGSTCSSMPIP